LRRRGPQRYDPGIVPDDSAIGNARFPTTRRSAVRGAQSADVAERDRSWTALVAAYWKPAYKHVRIKWKASREDAEDATQGFFERAMAAEFFATFEPGRARFRTFFRVCLDRYVSNERKANLRKKRGGGAQVLPLDFAEAEQELARAGAAAWESPEESFDREWRRSVFSLALVALRVELAAAGKGAHFALFEAYDLCASPTRPTYDELAVAHGVPVTTVTNHLAYGRRELRRLVIATLEEITLTDEELGGEAAFLLGPQGPPAGAR
jgi:RNA polymerase sigma factor (sigma-70 family)